MSSASPDNAPEAPDWTVVAVLYLALALGIGGLLYVGNYRNAVWLALIGTGGGLTAYGRVLQARGAPQPAAAGRGRPVPSTACSSSGPERCCCGHCFVDDRPAGRRGRPWERTALQEGRRRWCAGRGGRELPRKRKTKTRKKSFDAPQICKGTSAHSPTNLRLGYGF